MVSVCVSRTQRCCYAEVVPSSCVCNRFSVPCCSCATATLTDRCLWSVLVGLAVPSFFLLCCFMAATIGLCAGDACFWCKIGCPSSL